MEAVCFGRIPVTLRPDLICVARGVHDTRFEHWCKGEERESYNVIREDVMVDRAADCCSEPAALESVGV